MTLSSFLRNKARFLIRLGALCIFESVRLWSSTQLHSVVPTKDHSSLNPLSIKYLKSGRSMSLRPPYRKIKSRVISWKNLLGGSYDTSGLGISTILNHIISVPLVWRRRHHKCSGKKLYACTTKLFRPRAHSANGEGMWSTSANHTVECQFKGRERPTRAASMAVMATRTSSSPRTPGSEQSIG